jgi:hypothetical protein
MYFHQYYLGCLSHASYLIGDTQSGRAVVVDPQRDVSQYLADAAANGLTITTVIETHFIENDEIIGGIGEPGLPPATPALVNALFALTGKPIRKLPIMAQLADA